MRAQQRCRADAGELQQLRRLQGPGAQDHVALRAGLPDLPALDPLHAHGTAALEQHPRHLGPQFQPQVRALPRGLQKGPGCAGAPTAPDGQLVSTDTKVRRRIEVGVARQAGLHARLHPGLAVRVVVAQVRDAELTLCAMEFAGPALITLGAAEVRQHAAVVPPHGPRPHPIGIVLMLAADVDQAVDGGRATHHPAPGPHDVAPARALGRLGVEQAREALVVDGLEVAHRQVDPEVAVRAARLQYQDATPRCAQALGQHATGRARADDDVIPVSRWYGGTHRTGLRAAAAVAEMGRLPEEHLWLRENSGLCRRMP